MNEAIVALAKKLIEIPSTAANKQALHDVLTVCKKELSDFGYEEFLDAGIPSILFFTGKTKPARFEVLLNAHVDVVPGNNEQFMLTTDGDKLMGRGTNDMKASAAVLILLFKQLAPSLPYSLGLQLVTDEEIGGFHGAKYQLEKGVTANFMLAGEPTDLGINTKAKGIMWGDIETTGKTAHGAYPWDGDNALTKLITIINNIQQAFPSPSEEVWRTTINISAIETTNTTYNKVPSDAKLKFDIRYIPEDADTIEQTLRSFLSDGAKLTIHAKESAHNSPENSQYLDVLQQAMQTVHGKKAEIIIKHGGSDVRFYTAAGGEGITFGPVGGGLHSDTEWVSKKGLEEYYNIMETFLKTLTV